MRFFFDLFFGIIQFASSQRSNAGTSDSTPSVVPQLAERAAKSTKLSRLPRPARLSKWVSAPLHLMVMFWVTWVAAL